ncbi:MAG: hypothetical protein ACI80V_002645 [Rhodothermales bacterium]
MFRANACFIALVILLPLDVARGQASLFIPVDDPVYSDIRSAQLRGFLEELNPTALPYTYDEVLGALERVEDAEPEHAWLLDRLARLLQPEGALEGFGVSGRLGARATTNGRLDPVRIREGGEPFFPFLELGFHWIDGPVIVRAGARQDLYWDSDPDGLDPVLRLLARNDQSYIGLSGSRGSVMLGRIGTEWASPGGTGLLISDNARSFDAIHIKVGNDKISLRSMIGELDSITGDGRFTGTAGDDSVSSGSERRWMSAHRLDWRVSPRLQISFMEASLYSGPSSGLSLKYLNPASFLVLGVDNRPKNDENNALLAMSVWARVADWTLEGQLMLDDYDILSSKEPSSIAATLDATTVLSPRWEFRTHFEAVGSRTYNTFQPEGRWTYLDRGIATQYSDYVTAEARASWLLPEQDLRLEPYVVGLWQGERDLRDAYRFGEDFDAILTGTAERTIRTAVRAVYSPGHIGYAAVDAGINLQDNLGHVQGASRVRGVLSAEVGLRWALGSPRKDP